MLKSVGDGRSETYPNLEKIQDNPNLIFFQAEMNVVKLDFLRATHTYIRMVILAIYQEIVEIPSKWLAICKYLPTWSTLINKVPIQYIVIS